MSLHTSLNHWMRYVVVRREVWKTTWLFRAVSIGLLYVIAQTTSSVWTRAVADSLVCSLRPTPRVDALLIDDLDSSYLPFERARILRQTGISSRVLVPIPEGANGAPAPVSGAIVGDLARMARVGDIESVPVVEVEPISLNVALRVRQYLTDNKIRSVAIVAPAFRSERSMLIYTAVLKPAGVAVFCVPVFAMRTPDTWTKSWHGVQEVALQFLKLQYYRLYVLPFRLSPTA